jgi:DNA-nicking Smr family endonuclease
MRIFPYPRGSALPSDRLDRLGRRVERVDDRLDLLGRPGAAAQAQAAEVMASIVAERIVSSLEAENFVVMRCPARGHVP